MKKEAIMNYYILNGKVKNVEDGDGFDEIKSKSIYEVIRIIDKTPLYMEDHIKRMRNSASLIGLTMSKSDREIEEEILNLIEVNDGDNLNIKLLYSEEEEKQFFLIYFIESHYPDEEVYKQGIDTILFHSKRDNPNAKVVNISLRERINSALKDHNAFEALLVNDQGFITEGSRSNMFFVEEDAVYTAPKGEVLLGVTRNHIMEVCKDLGIKVIEENIHVDKLKKIQGAFMTGTSVNVLPIRTIDENEYSSVNNKIIRKIAEGYENDMKEYIYKFRNNI